MATKGRWSGAVLQCANLAVADFEMAKALFDPVADDPEALESAHCWALESLAVEAVVEKPSDAIR
jgi:hypothetical protein